MYVCENLPRCVFVSVSGHSCVCLCLVSVVCAHSKTQLNHKVGVKEDIMGGDVWKRAVGVRLNM